MAYTHRTLLRHLGLAMLLLSFPLVLAPLGQVRLWYLRHFWFFFCLLVGAFLIGIGSDLAVRRGLAKGMVGTLPLPDIYQRWALKWAGCSRCVAWWLAGFYAFVLSLLYWELRSVWWQNLIVWFLFSSLGASWAAGVSVAAYFLRRKKKSNDNS